MNWTYAEAYCNSIHKSHLATILNNDDNDEWQSIRPSTDYFCWIGLNDINDPNSGNWEWIDGTSSNNYFNWANRISGSEPNGINQHCVFGFGSAYGYGLYV